MKGYLLPHLLSFPWDRRGPPFHLPSNKFIKESLHTSPWPTDASSSVSFQSLLLAFWTSDQSPTRITKNVYWTCGGRKERVFSAGLVLVGTLQRKILARRRAGRSPAGENAGLWEEVPAAQPWGKGGLSGHISFHGCSLLGEE